MHRWLAVSKTGILKTVGMRVGGRVQGDALGAAVDLWRSIESDARGLG